MKSENPALMRHGSSALDHLPAGVELPTAIDAANSGISAGEAVISSADMPRSFISRVASRLMRALRMHRTSHALLRLSDDELKDIGLARCQVYGDFERYRQSQSHALERRSRPGL